MDHKKDAKTLNGSRHGGEGLAEAKEEADQNIMNDYKWELNSKSHSDSELESSIYENTTDTSSRDLLKKSRVSHQHAKEAATELSIKAETKAGRGRKKANKGLKSKKQPQSKPASSLRNKSASLDRKATRNTVLTDYFPVRRSCRMSSEDLKNQKIKDTEAAILENREEGLKVVDYEGKGRGVVATKAFRRGDFVVEYYGDLIDKKTAEAREKSYAANPEFGCYMYYFLFRNKTYCVDATAESGRLGRLLNHSKTAGNCATKVMGIGDQPHLILVAARDVDEGEELLYDYGDRSKSSLEAHPWLAR